MELICILHMKYNIKNEPALVGSFLIFKNTMDKRSTNKSFSDKCYIQYLFTYMTGVE